MATPVEPDRLWAKTGQVLLPAGATAFVAFQAGGYFAGATASAALLLGLAIALVLAAGRAPLRALGPAGLVAAGSLAALAAWQLASSAWSDAAGRAVIDADRTLLYLLALVLGAVALGRPDRRRRAVVGLALGLLGVCVAALLARTLPEALHTTPSPVEAARASFPLTYWNALGLTAALTLVLGLHFASARGPLALRLGAAAAVPIAVATLLLTFSRGGIAVAAVGLLAYVVLAPTRLTVAGLLAAGPPAAVAAVVAVTSHLDPGGPQAVGDGHRVLFVTAACAIAALVLRAVLDRVVDARAGDRAPEASPALRRTVYGTVAAALAVAVVALAATGALSRAYDDFAHHDTHVTGGQTEQRLTQLSGNGRIDAWHTALRMWTAAPLGGKGAGTFSTWWFAQRPDTQDLFDAHSLYAETLGELGVVGFALLVVPLVLILWRLGSRYRRRRDPIYAALLAVTLAWALHAAIDWDWEMPAVTLWLFLLGGAVLARPTSRATPRTGVAARALAVAGLALALVLPAREGWSQHRLNEAAGAYRQGRCADVARRALDSLSAMPVRAEPYQLIGYCDLRIGAPADAVKAFRLGLERDPRSWPLTYALAVGRAAAGGDPRSATLRALELNPREQLVRRLARALGPARRDSWVATAADLPLPPP